MGCFGVGVGPASSKNEPLRQQRSCARWVFPQPANQGIASRLKPGGILVTSDLASDTASPAYASLLEVWLRTMAGAALSPERVEQMRAAYARDVAILPTSRVEAVIANGGFDAPVRFFQAGLIHGWYGKRLSGDERPD
jgi:tRNA (cmo5U34)-methyltransferase